MRAVSILVTLPRQTPEQQKNNSKILEEKRCGLVAGDTLGRSLDGVRLRLGLADGGGHGGSVRAGGEAYEDDMLGRWFYLWRSWMSLGGGHTGRGGVGDGAKSGDDGDDGELHFDFGWRGFEIRFREVCDCSRSLREKKNEFGRPATK